MQTTQFGPLTVRLLGGDDGEGGGRGPLVVLSHGFGASGEDLVGLGAALADVLPKDVRYAFPAAPLELPAMMPGMESRAWWMIDMAAMERAIATGTIRDMSGSIPHGLPDARAMLSLCVAEMMTALTPSKLVLGGFSQGAMVSVDVALHSDVPLAGLVVMSGTLLGRDDWVPRMKARAAVPVFQSHGERDPLLPFSMAEELRDEMVGAGLGVEFVGFGGAHEIPMPVLQRLVPYLSKVLETA